MSATTHHEIHPDAEILSAFAEQALSAKERGQVFEHLAVCSRCREIVALTREAAGAEPVAPRLENLRPRAWLRTWGLVLAPVAAVAATAVIAVYVHQRDVERNAEVAKLEHLRADKRTPSPPQAPQPSAHPAQPASSRSALEKTKKAERPEPTEQSAPIDELHEMAAAPPPEMMKGMLSARGGPVENPEFERRRKTDDALAPPGPIPDATTPSDAAVFNVERKKWAEEQKDDRHPLAARAADSPREHDSGSSAPGSANAESTGPADVSAQQLETQPAPTAGSLQLHGLRSMMDVATGPHAFHLPSGLPAVSSASADHRMLAIDKQGELFLSEDSGASWEKVKRQWAGHATLVRRHANGIDATGATRTPETSGEPSDSGAVSQPDTVFELVNDQSQVWISVDGRIWTTK